MSGLGHAILSQPAALAAADVYEDKPNVHIVEELCSGGELFDSIIEVRATRQDVACGRVPVNQDHCGVQ